MIDLLTARAHLHVSAGDEDALIGAYLNAARGAVEAATSKLLSSQNVVQRAAGFPCADKAIRLWKGPVTAIVSVKYDDSDGVEQTLASFRLVEGANAKLLPAYGSSWPVAKAAEGSVRITYTAGYAADEIPPELDQAMLLLIGHFYANREAVVAGSAAQTAELPLGVEALIAPYRTPGIG
jgi:uncharacterized phiE125 gp8 family phage protein